MITRKQTIEALQAQGLCSDLAALAADSPALKLSRHRERVAAARMAAIAQAATLSVDEGEVFATPDPITMAVAGVLLRAEMEEARRGDSRTVRLPGFGCLGKGRRQASDGPAWTAAIESAALDLIGDIRVGPSGATLWGGESAEHFRPVYGPIDAEDGILALLARRAIIAAAKAIAEGFVPRLDDVDGNPATAALLSHAWEVGAFSPFSDPEVPAAAMMADAVESIL